MIYFYFFFLIFRLIVDYCILINMCKVNVFIYIGIYLKVNILSVFIYWIKIEDYVNINNCV